MFGRVRNQVPLTHVQRARKMPRVKVDNRIRVMVENGVALRQRTMFVIVGDKGRDQVAGCYEKIWSF